MKDTGGIVSTTFISNINDNTDGTDDVLVAEHFGVMAESLAMTLRSLAKVGIEAKEAAQRMAINLEEIAALMEEVREAARDVLRWQRVLWEYTTIWRDPLPAVPFVSVRAVRRLGRDISGAAWRRLRG